MHKVNNQGFLVGYARVSTEDQSLALQTEALARAGVLPDNLHIEKVSGAGHKRPELEAAILDLRPGDTLIVWRLDRLARSMRQLYQILDRIYGKGATFRSLTEDFDFNTMTGKLIIAVLGAIAEFERQVIAARTRAGIAALKAGRGSKDWKWGKPVYMTRDKIKLAGDYLNGRNGKKRLSGPKVAKKMGVSTASVYAFWKQSGPGQFVRKAEKK